MTTDIEVLVNRQVIEQMILLNTKPICSLRNVRAPSASNDGPRLHPKIFAAPAVIVHPRMCSNVDLPAPDGPITEIKSPLERPD